MTVYPPHVAIETFHSCTARCTFCHVNQWARPKGQMPDNIFYTLLKQLDGWAQIHVTQTTLILNGEPLFDPKLEERLSACRAAGLPNVGFTSNAHLMNETRAASIVQSDPHYVVFSFDSLDKSRYEEGRLRLNYDRVLNNILNFIIIRNEAKSSLRIVIRHIDFLADGKEFTDYLKYF